MNDHTNVINYKRNLILVAVSSTLLAILGTLGILFWMGRLNSPESSQQAMVHDMSAHVMPFELGKTKHIFEMTESGGIQEVVANDPHDSTQIALIQQHLQHESLMFSAGDFSDPSSLHGNDMPGVPELSSGAAQIKIEYAALPNGARITFTTQDLQLVTAIHRWFGAQLSDHGADAIYR